VVFRKKSTKKDLKMKGRLLGCGKIKGGTLERFIEGTNLIKVLYMHG
jgi:hypothetical protein